MRDRGRLQRGTPGIRENQNRPGGQGHRYSGWVKIGVNFIRGDCTDTLMAQSHWPRPTSQTSRYSACSVSVSSSWFIHTDRVPLRDRYRFHDILLSMGLGHCEHFHTILVKPFRPFLHVTFLARFIKMARYCLALFPWMAEKMGPSTIQPVIQPITIDTMLNNNSSFK